MGERSPTGPVIALEGASKTYPGGAGPVVALAPTDLDLEPGAFACLAGPSGSGKTTLLNLAGVLDLPTTGRVRVGGEPTGGMTRSAAARLRNRWIGFVFQQFNLVPVLTALENVAYSLQLQGCPWGRARSRALHALEMVGMADLAHRRPDALSGGQQQRVAVARAVVTKPPVVLADEPTANLDSGAAEALLDRFEALNRREGIAFVFSSHDPRVIKRARRVIRLVDGAVVDDTGPDDDGPR